MANELANLKKSKLISDLNIPDAVSSLDNAVRNSSNPLKQGLPLKSKNIFIDVIDFAMEHNKELLYTILCLTTGNISEFGPSTVIITAKIYMAMASRLNQKNSTFKKLQGIVLQSCGLTDIGLDILATLGETVTARTLLDTRTHLAIEDENRVRGLSQHFHSAIVIDNLDRTVKKVLQHQTLPVLLSREVPVNYYQMNTERKSLEDATLLFTPAFFSIDSPCHDSEKKSMMQVTNKTTSKIILMHN